MYRSVHLHMINLMHPNTLCITHCHESTTGDSKYPSCTRPKQKFITDKSTLSITCKSACLSIYNSLALWTLILLEIFLLPICTQPRSMPPTLVYRVYGGLFGVFIGLFQVDIGLFGSSFVQGILPNRQLQTAIFERKFVMFPNLQ